MSSMMEDVLGGAMKQAGVGGGSSGGAGGMMGMLQPAVTGMLSGGGLSDIVGNMQSQGMGAEADSWVGGGENRPISPDQAKKAVGPDRVKALASKAGISEDQAASVLAGALPQVVDEVSPEGRMPDATGVDDAMRKPRRKRAKRADDGGRRPPEKKAKRADDAGRRQRKKGARR